MAYYWNIMLYTIPPPFMLIAHVWSIYLIWSHLKLAQVADKERPTHHYSDVSSTPNLRINFTLTADGEGAPRL